MEVKFNNKYGIAAGLMVMSVLVCVIIPFLMTRTDGNAYMEGLHWIIWEIPALAYTLMAMYWGGNDKKLYTIALPAMAIAEFLCLVPMYGTGLAALYSLPVSGLMALAGYLMFGEINRSRRRRTKRRRKTTSLRMTPYICRMEKIGALVFLSVLFLLQSGYVPGHVEEWHGILCLLPLCIFAVCAWLYCQPYPYVFYSLGTIVLWAALVLCLSPRMGFSVDNHMLSMIVTVVSVLAVAILDLLSRKANITGKGVR